MDVIKNFLGIGTNHVEKNRLSSQPGLVLDNVCEHLDVADLINMRGVAPAFAPSVRTALVERVGEAKREELVTMKRYTSEPGIRGAALRELVRRQIIGKGAREPTQATKKALGEFLHKTLKVDEWVMSLATAIAYHDHQHVDETIATRSNYIPQYIGLKQLCELAITARNVRALNALIHTTDSPSMDHDSLISSIKKVRGDGSFENEAIQAVQKFQALGRRDCWTL